jgi:hypothetical protein
MGSITNSTDVLAYSKGELMEALDFELIMANAFDSIVSSLYDVIIQMIPTVIIIVGIVIVVGVAVSFFKDILVEDDKARDKEDRQKQKEFDRSIKRFGEEWGNDDTMSGAEFWDNHYVHNSYNQTSMLDEDYCENTYSWFD